MKHFDISEWTDYARGLISDANRAAMEEHLASGCRRCERTADLLRKLVATAAAEARYDVPQYAIHCARAIYALQQPEKVHILPRIVARLIYDSFREPLPEGVRTRHRLSRQAMYQAGDFCLDLRLEHERGSTRVTLIGQIENRAEPSRRMASVPVLLVAGKEILARAVSNQFGEFQMEYEPRRNMRLYVPVNGDSRRIEVSLNELLGDDAKAKDSARTVSSSKKRKK